MSYLPFHHKYRPQTFADLVGQEAIAATLTNALCLGKIAPAYLFTGPRGTGKTSSARIFAKSLNCTASAVPTAVPCGQCGVCRSIAAGNAMDVIEIDAASNTGVDNIRELIERAQYAPVQCRYKVYTIDECLTGDALVLTSTGLMQIDDPQIEGKKVLSYNDDNERWEYKQVIRQLNQGERQTFVIQTTNREIRCTDNHLIRTDKGWIPARNLKAGMKILSPVNVDAALSSPNLGQIDVSADSCADISSEEILTDKNYMIVNRSSHKLNQFVHSVPVAVKKNSISPPIYKPKVEVSVASVWGQMPVESGWKISSNTPFPQWHTSLETIESVCLGGVEQVYDIEVSDNHNFVANGLLVHNCHMLSTAAFNSLLKTLEEPPPRVVFILATTDPQRVLPTIISRCQKFDYRRIPLEAMIGHLAYIAQNEGMAIDDQALRLVAQISQGGLRDAESLLDQLSLVGEEVTIDRVWDLVGSVPERDLLGIATALHQGDLTAVLDRCRQLLERGKEPLTVLQNLTSFYRDLSIAKAAPQRPDLTSLTSETWAQVVTLTQQLDLATILTGQQRLKESEAQLKGSTQPHLWLEIALLALLPTLPASSPAPASPQPVAKTPPVIEVAAQPRPAPTPSVSNHQPDPIEPSPVANDVNTHSHKVDAPGKNVQVADINLRDIGVEIEDPIFGDLSEPVPVPEIPPTPVAAAPPPVVPEPAPTYDLASIWQQVLHQLLPSGKGLFTPHGVLLSIEGNVALVGMKSNTLSKLGEGQKPHLQKALTNVLGRPIVVTIQLASAKGTPPAATLPVTISPNNPPPLITPIAEIATTAIVNNASPSKIPEPIAEQSPRIVTDLSDEILTEAEEANDFDENEVSNDQWAAPINTPHIVAEEAVPLSLFDQPIAIPVITDPPVPANPLMPTNLPEPVRTNVPDSFTIEELDAAAISLAQRFSGEVVEEYVTLWDL